MNLEYVPEDCKGEKAKFDGKVILKMPSFQQRHLYMTECNFGTVKDSTNLAANKDNIKSIVTLVEKSKDHYVKVDLVKKSDGKKFAKFDELTFDPDCDGILREVAMAMLQGFQAGKS